MAQPPQDPPDPTADKVRHLVPVPSRKPQTVAGRTLQRWWTKKHLADILDAGEVSMAEAIHDVGLASLAHMMKRLMDPKTPMKVKDDIASRMGPKVGVLLTGNLNGDKAKKRSKGVSGVLGAYGLGGEPES